MNLKCPECGYEGKTPPKQRGKDEPFLYLEDIVCYRKVLLAEELEDDDDELHVEGFYQTGEGFDDGSKARLMCGDCLAEFPLAEGVVIAWE